MLALTPPYRDPADRMAFTRRQTVELGRLGLTDRQTGRIDDTVADWVRLVCHPQRWIELRCLRGGSASVDMLRGVVARRGKRTVVALRNAQLITFTEVGLHDAHDLVPILCAGLPRRPPARFGEFVLPARVGKRADQQLRDGAELATLLDYLGIPASARPVVRAAFAGPRSYVEIVVGQNIDGVAGASEVGVAIVDTTEGRILVSPRMAVDGEWVSTFEPGTPFAVARAVENLTATQPDGRWFPDSRLTRDFTTQAAGTAR